MSFDLFRSNDAPRASGAPAPAISEKESRERGEVSRGEEKILPRAENLSLNCDSGDDDDDEDVDAEEEIGLVKCLFSKQTFGDVDSMLAHVKEAYNFDLRGTIKILRTCSWFSTHRSLVTTKSLFLFQSLIYMAGSGLQTISAQKLGMKQYRTRQ
jgi:hypothetical protein